MKVLAFVLSIVLATVLAGAAGLAIAVTAQPGVNGYLGFAVGAEAVFVYGPVTFGTVLTYFDPQRSAESRRAFRRWVIVIGALEIVAVGAIITYSILTSAPAWLPVGFIVVAAALLVVSFLVGNALRNSDERRVSTEPGWSPIDRDQIRRKVTVVVVTFVVTFVVVAAILWLIFSSIGKSDLPVGLSISYASGFAFLASGFACSLTLLSLNRQLRQFLRRDLGVARRFGRIVMRGKSDKLEDDEQVPAARYAATLAVTLPFQLASVALLYAGLLINSLNQLTARSSGDQSTITYGTIAFLVVVVLILFPLQIVRIVRVRRYAAGHADLLESQATA